MKHITKTHILISFSWDIFLLEHAAGWHKNKRKDNEIFLQRNETCAAARQPSVGLAGSQQESRCLSVSKISNTVIDFINCNLVFLDFQNADVSFLTTVKIIRSPFSFVFLEVIQPYP